MENPCGLCLSENGEDLKTGLTYSGAKVIFLLFFPGLRPSEGFVFDSPRAHNTKFSCEVLLYWSLLVIYKRFIKVTSFENCESNSEKRQGGRSGTCYREPEWDEREKCREGKEQELVGVIWLCVYSACCSQAHLIHAPARSQHSVLLRHAVVLMERCSPHSLLAVVRTRSAPRMHLFKSCFGKPVLRRSELLLLFIFWISCGSCFFLFACNAW